MYDTICRLCLKDFDTDDPDGGSICDEKIRKAMENVFNFEVCFEEELPQNICKQCSWNVQDFQCFSEIVEKNQDKLKQKYASSMKLNCTGDGSMEKMDHDSCDKKKLSKESSNKSELPKVSSSTLSHTYLGSNLCDDHMMDIAIKTELDEVDVVNEPHPDIMGTSFTGIEQWRSIISCEDYKITSSDYDTTECSTIEENYDNFLELMEENNNPPNKLDKDKSKSKQRKKDCLRRSNRLSDQCPGNFTETEQNQCKSSNEPSKVKNEKENQPKTNDKGKFVCSDCGKAFPIQRKLQLHRITHQKQACVICGKILRRKSMRKHLATHKREIIESFVKKRDAKKTS